MSSLAQRSGSALLVLAALGALGAVPAPTSAQMPDLEHRSYEPRLRPTLLGYDPFGELLPGRFGLGFTAGAQAANNSLDLNDAGAFILLSNEDSLTVWDVLSAAGKVRNADGFVMSSAGRAQGHLLLAFGGLTLGLHGGGRVYGEAKVEESIVDLLASGNPDGADFTLSGSGGWALATAEAGARATLRFSGSYAFPDLVFGVGGRMIRPAFYAEGALARGGRVVVSGDSLVAQVDVDYRSTEYDTAPEFSDRLTDSGIGGSGMAWDFMARAEWDAFALEVEALDIGSVRVGSVERRSLTTNYAVTSVDSLITLVDERKANAAGDTLDLVIQGVGDEEVSLPRTLRARVGYELARWVYLDGAYALRSSRFGRRSRSDAGITLAPIRWFPLRAGMILQDGSIGYAGSVAIDSGPFVLHLQAASLSGFLDRGKGIGTAVRFMVRF